MYAPRVSSRCARSAVSCRPVLLRGSTSGASPATAASADDRTPLQEDAPDLLRDTGLCRAAVDAAPPRGVL